LLSSRTTTGLSALAPAQRAGAQRLCALAQSGRGDLAICLITWPRSYFAAGGPGGHEERGINGVAAVERLRIRKEQSAPLLEALEVWLREQRGRLSRSASVAEPIDYMLKRWDRFARFIDDGRICLTNNAAERALRGFALGRKSWLFAGSDRGADRAAVMATLIITARLNDVDPQAWLADVLARINDHAIHRLDELLPWNWRKPMPSCTEAA
jgi:transposase